VKEYITVQEMRLVLAETSHKIKVIDLYDALIFQEQNVYSENMVERITLPFEDSAYLDKLNPILDFDARNGGSFIKSDSLPLEKNRLTTIAGKN
jgi:hypothetical protein